MANSSNDAHIPTGFRANLLEMRAVKPTTGNIPTVFFGIVHKEYTEAMYDRHATRIKNLFQFKDNNRCCSIKVVPVAQAENVVDNDKLAEDMNKAMEMINNLQPQTIRIVGLGVGSSIAVTEALESLLLGWEIPANAKEVQFVALGESADFHYLNFCKSLCMKQMIKSLQYYNTMDYNSFGYLRAGGAGVLAGMPVDTRMANLQLAVEVEDRSSVSSRTPTTCSSLSSPS